jgi:hypothetical protein
MGRITMRGACAKVTTRCTIVTTEGETIVGENWCANPQPDGCPRKVGEDYTKCRTVCQQYGHAEIMAIFLAGEKCQGATAYLEGHTYYCQNCQEHLFGMGVVALKLGKPRMEDILND